MLRQLRINNHRLMTCQQSEAHQHRLGLQPETHAQAVELMNNTNPWIIPRNHQIEQAIVDAYGGDYALFERLNQAFKSPYEVNPANEDLTLSPTKEQVVRRTFCGT